MAETVRHIYVNGDLHHRVLRRAEEAERLAIYLSEALAQVMDTGKWTGPQDVAFRGLIAQAGDLEDSTCGSFDPHDCPPTPR